MPYILMPCPKCRGRGRLAVPSVSTEPTVTEVRLSPEAAVVAEAETVFVRKAFPVRCRVCEGTGVMHVELPGLVDLEGMKG
jgi:hypothetical protein